MDFAAFASQVESQAQQGSPASDEHAGKSQRILACRLCQQRKVKCDRQFPCANCIRSRTQCVPATQAPRKKRRRLHERELLDRLKKYETLLKQHNIDYDHIQTEPIGDEPGDTKTSTQADASSPAAFPTTALGDKPYDGVNLFNAMKNLRINDDGDLSETDLNEDTMERTWDRAYANTSDLLFGSQKAFIDLTTLQPDVVHIFRLWQIYLDNVNPMLKVTHTPTLQGRIMQAAADLANIPADLEALMFGIYCMAVVSCTDDYCQASFGISRADLLTRFSFGCEQALMKADFLKGASRDVLTAFLLYLLSAWPRDPRHLSALLSMGVRLGYRLGLHSETMNKSCNVLEGELRRRLWWSLVLFEVRMSQLSRDKTTNMLPIWDCKPPSNLDDIELREDMTELPAPRDGPTEASYVVVRSEVADYVRHTNFFLNLNNPALRVFAKTSVKENENELDEIENRVGEKYLSHFNEGNPLQAMNIWTTQNYLGRFRLSEFLIKVAAEDAGHPSEEEREEAMKNAISVLESDTRICTSPLTKGFVWTANFTFPFPAYYHAVQDLKRRPTNPDTQRAWDAIEGNLNARLNSKETDPLALYLILGKMILSAWKAREEYLGKQGIAIPTPPNLAKLRDIMMSDATTRQILNSSSSPSDNMLNLTPSTQSQPTLDSFGSGPQALPPSGVDSMIWPATPLDPFAMPLQWSPGSYSFDEQRRW